MDVNATLFTMNDLVLFGQEIPGNVVFSLCFLLPIVVAGNLKLFLKANQAAWKVFVPGVNVATAMRIIGRPGWHAWLFLIPGFNIYLVFKTLIELAQSFGKKSALDYVLISVFSVFYVLNLGLAYEEVYQGPVYGSASKKKEVDRGFAAA
jgi:hypothetical protein